jgi:hypothetical protein
MTTLGLKGDKMILVVTGSRKASIEHCEAEIIRVVNEFSGDKDNVAIWQGGCRSGADYAARMVASTKKLASREFKADWDKGPKGGPVRNKEMMQAARDAIDNAGAVVCVLALPAHGEANKGTISAVCEGMTAGLEVHTRWVPSPNKEGLFYRQRSKGWGARFKKPIEPKGDLEYGASMEISGGFARGALLADEHIKRDLRQLTDEIAKQAFDSLNNEVNRFDNAKIMIRLILRK